MKLNAVRFATMGCFYVLIVWSSLTVLQAQALFTNGPGSPISIQGGATSVATGDFNNDGNLDLVVSRRSSTSNSQYLEVFLGNGNGGFVAGPSISLGSGAGSVLSVAVADFNGDGNLDLAVAESGGCDNTSVEVLFGDGHGGFTEDPRTPIAMSFIPVSLRAVDLNGDGHTDLLVSGYGLCGTTDGMLQVLLGDGAGGFTSRTPTPRVTPGAGQEFVAVGDFNGDHVPDLAVAGQISGRITIMRGNADGTFSASGSPITVGGYPISIVTGDFNNDGNLDLAIGISGVNPLNGQITAPDRVSVLLGNGLGAFFAAPGSPYVVGPGISSVATGDFNGDGNLDLAVSDSQSNEIAAFLGNGTGAFAAAPGSPFAVGESPVDIVAGDFDADGRPDLAIQSGATNANGVGSVSILRTAKTTMNQYHQCDGENGNSNVPVDFDNDTQPTCKYGCALTSTANVMSLVNSEITPAALDNFLSDTLYGYTDGGLLGWGTVAEWSLLPYKYDLVDSLSTLQQKNALGYLQKHLADRVILQLCFTQDGSTCLYVDSTTGNNCIPTSANVESCVKDTHYVAAWQPNGEDDWLVFDPGWSNAPFSLKTHERGFMATTESGATKEFQFKVIGALAYQTVTDQSSLQIVAQSPVEFLVTDPSGRQLGNISSSKDIFGIPRGSYFRDFPIADDEGGDPPMGEPTAVKTAYVPGPQNGTYAVQVMGTTLGKYTLDFHAVATDGSTQNLTVSGVTNGGQTTLYEVDYSPSPGAVFTVTHVVTFQTTLNDINDCFGLGLIENEGIAQALLSQIIAAAAAATSGDNTSAESILNSFISLVNAQSSVHINGVAPQILLHDANSLLNQLR